MATLEVHGLEVAPVSPRSAISLRLTWSLTGPTEWAKVRDSWYIKQAILSLGVCLDILSIWASIAGQAPFKTKDYDLTFLLYRPSLPCSPSWPRLTIYISLAILELLVWTRLAFNSLKSSCLILLSISYPRLLLCPVPHPLGSNPAQRTRDVTTHHHSTGAWSLWSTHLFTH